MLHSLKIYLLLAYNVECCIDKCIEPEFIVLNYISKLFALIF